MTSLGATDVPTFADVEDAARQLKGWARETPILENPILNDELGFRLLVKPECLQWIGAFKFRGAFNRISRIADADKAKGVVAFSSGNHAQGVARASALLGISATIIMPSDAPKMKIDNTRALGANVLLYDRAKESREEIGEAITTYFPPILDVAAARLVADSQHPVANDPFVTGLPSQALNALTDDSGVFLGCPNKEQGNAFTAAGISVPPSACIVRLPKDLPTSSHDIVLLLAGNTKDSFTPSHGIDLLTQLVMKIAIALAARPSGIK